MFFRNANITEFTLKDMQTQQRIIGIDFPCSTTVSQERGRDEEKARTAIPLIKR